MKLKEERGMFQYAKKVLNEKVEEHKQRKRQKEQEKDEIDRKVVAITDHESLKRILKRKKEVFYLQ